MVIVEDDDALRELLRRILERSGNFTVVGEAENGRDGIVRVAELRPDLVMLDIKMPIMTGIEALPEIRSRAPDSVVVVLSMLRDEKVRKEALRLGAREYLDKNMDNDSLLHRLMEIMKSSTPRVAPPRGAEQREGQSQASGETGFRTTSQEKPSLPFR